MPISPATTTGLTGHRIGIAAGPSRGHGRGRGTVARSGRIARVAVETPAETREAAAAANNAVTRRMTPAALGVSSRSTKEQREFDSVREKELRRRELERRRRLE